jgi:hypothetical protein
LIALLLLPGLAYADAKSDLSRALSDFDTFKSKTDDLRTKVDRYLEDSRALRAMDKEKLDKLIDRMCRLDIEPNDSEVDRLATELVKTSVDEVGRGYERTVDVAKGLIEQIERTMNDAKSLRDRSKSLMSEASVRDDASKVFDQANRLVETIDKLMEKVQSDWRSLDNVKAGVMNGSNNPTIRARMEYGKEKHRSLQSSRSCDEKEVVLNSGRPDCIKFEPEACKIIEFKPDTWTESQAREQALKYVDDVRKKYKGDDRAKKCKQDADGYPSFAAVPELYPACRP